MTTPSSLIRRDPLSSLDPHDVVDDWERRGLDELSDGELIERCASHLSVPRRDPADSFVLHAPLELLARSALLRLVGMPERRRARQRIAWLAASYDSYEPYEAVSDPAPAPPSGHTVMAPIDRLTEGVAAGDLDDIDRATLDLVDATSTGELVCSLGDLVVDRLAAAAHGSIFLYQLPRLLAADRSAASMARGLMREIGRRPTWAVTWMDQRDSGTQPTRDLRDRLLGMPDAGEPESNFIYPTMSLVDRSGLASEVLSSSTMGLGVKDARRDLLRVAAWSMLQDDPGHAPYGWSHALTMPQATLGIAGSVAHPDRAVAVAATFVLGFRATLASTVLDPAWEPPVPRGIDDVTFLDAGPDVAAAAVWHAADDDAPRYVRRLASFAALHSDAHLAKYTLACLDATRDDPAAGRLYLAAAGFLAGWWRARGADDALFGGSS